MAIIEIHTQAELDALPDSFTDFTEIHIKNDPKLGSIAVRKNRGNSSVEKKSETAHINRNKKWNSGSYWFYKDNIEDVRFMRSLVGKQPSSEEMMKFKLFTLNNIGKSECIKEWILDQPILLEKLNMILTFS